MMNARRIFFVVTLLTLLTGLLASTGCNTWRGAGKDVQSTGEAMQGKD